MILGLSMPAVPPNGRSTDRQMRAAGFSLIELVVVVAVIAIVTAVGAPLFISYLQSATLTAGTQELASILNRGRLVAISQNTTVCVTLVGNQVRFLTGGCGGVVFTGPGTDGNGFFTLANNVNVSAATANVVFTSDAGTLVNFQGTVAGTGTDRSLTVAAANARLNRQLPTRAAGQSVVAGIGRWKRPSLPGQDASLFLRACLMNILNLPRQLLMPNSTQ